jgi:hypothetical protein
MTAGGWLFMLRCGANLQQKQASAKRSKVSIEDANDERTDCSKSEER